MPKKLTFSFFIKKGNYKKRDSFSSSKNYVSVILFLSFELPAFK